jgi:hypothetical protein
MNFILGDKIPDLETVSAEQRMSAVETAVQFERVFLDPRPIFQKLRETDEESWPKSAYDLERMLQRPGGAYWNFAIGLYSRATDKPVTEERIKIFVRECPPFRAILAALMVAQYERAVRSDEPQKFAGRNDLFMAGYLPYCDEFISNDRLQQTALREVVCIAQLQTSVRWYREFSEQLRLGGVDTGSRSRS